MKVVPVQPLSGRICRTLLSKLQFVCVDVGARDGIIPDLVPIASSVKAIGLEPDTEECKRLNTRPDPIWKSCRFIPEAAGGRNETRQLHLYRARGCSSILKANPEFVARFSREDWFKLEGECEVQLRPLDDLAIEYGFTETDYLKLDIQGMEYDALAGAGALLRNLIAIRVEVEFRQLYENQPLYQDVAKLLFESGFFPADFVEIHRWRRIGQRGTIQAETAPRPKYSRGEIVHADVLFLKSEDQISRDSSKATIEAKLRASVLASLYDQLDYATALLREEDVSSYLKHEFGVDVEDLIADLDHNLCTRQALRYMQDGVSSLARSAKMLVSNLTSD